jgi:electron transfer flavoprotein alpha subunit
VIAVVPVRDGTLPAGADATVWECAGRVLVIGQDAARAASTLRGSIEALLTCEAGVFAPAAWSRGLAGVLQGEREIVLPGSPDGRDLAGRLAAAMDRACHAWCTSVSPSHVVMTRLDGAQSVTVPAPEPFVATIVPFHVAEERSDTARPPIAREVTLVASTQRDVTVEGVDEADPGEVDLAEASRIVAGGLGLGGTEQFGRLAELAHGLRASLGATRPVADRGIVGHERQIGTTGAMVDPVLYVAFGISGAVQHTAGLGHPERIISVNTDASCPMMAMADLAVVADAAATARALLERLGGTAT